MADKLDKWLSDEQSKWAFRSYQVAHGEDREKQSYYETRHHLHGPVSSPPAGELVVPAGGEQLLAVGLSNELVFRLPRSKGPANPSSPSLSLPEIGRAHF